MRLPAELCAPRRTGAMGFFRDGVVDPGSSDKEVASPRSRFDDPCAPAPGFVSQSLPRVPPFRRGPPAQGRADRSLHFSPRGARRSFDPRSSKRSIRDRPFASGRSAGSDLHRTAAASQVVGLRDADPTILSSLGFQTLGFRALLELGMAGGKDADHVARLHDERPDPGEAHLRGERPFAGARLVRRAGRNEEPSPSSSTTPTRPTRRRRR